MYHMLVYAASCIATVSGSWEIPEKCKPLVDTTYYSAKECHVGSIELQRDRSKRVICLGPGETFAKKPVEEERK